MKRYLIMPPSSDLDPDRPMQICKTWFGAQLAAFWQGLMTFDRVTIVTERLTVAPFKNHSREAFEAWLKETGYFTDWSRDKTNDANPYNKPLVERTWQAWQAAISYAQS